jgi:hypothetical protein
MDGMPTTADAAHPMTTALRYQQHDKAGRFGREVLTMPDDGEMGDVSAGRGAESLGTGRYEIDAHAVAEVILARLAVGGTLRLPEGDALPEPGA